MTTMVMINLSTFLNLKFKKIIAKNAYHVFLNFYKSIICIQQLISNLYILYKYTLTLACTQTNCERSFSKLKIIKKQITFTMEQDLFNAQLLPSIDNDYLPDTESIIDTISESSTIFLKMIHFIYTNIIQDVY